MFSWLKRILWSRKPSRPTAATQRKPSWRRSTFLQMEALEDRVTPSNVWTVNSANGGAAAGAGQSGNLAYCIAGANADNTGAETINFSSLPADTTITLTNALSPLHNTHGETITINGSGTTGLVISGAAAYQPFFVDNVANVLIENLTITDGAATSGGGVYNTATAGTLTLQNDTISASTATGSGGGIYNAGGNLVITGSTISSNSAGVSGGGIENDAGSLTVTGGTISGNFGKPFPSYGGGIDNDGGTLIVNGGALIEDNFASYGGGISSEAGGTLNVSGSTIENNNTNEYGGGIFLTGSGTATISNATITGNTSDLGGGIMNDESTATIGGSSTTIDDNSGGDGAGVFSLFATTTIQSGVTISGNTATVDGGGIYVYGGETISDGTVSDNVAGANGGGIFGNDSALAISDTIIQGNTSTAGAGGGVDAIASSTVTLTDATITGNIAGTNGGGINIDASSTGAVVNSTISGNSAAADGGGIYNTNVLAVIAGTISANTATHGSGIYDDPDATALTLYDSIVSANFTGDDIESGAALAVAGDYDLIGTYDVNTNITAGTHDVITSSPGLSALAGNNAILNSETMADTFGSSAAYDSGPSLSALNSALSTDLPAGVTATFPAGYGISQDARGYSRPTSGQVDIGSYQSFGTPSVTVSNSNLASDAPTAPITGAFFSTLDPNYVNLYYYNGVGFTLLNVSGPITATDISSSSLTVSLAGLGLSAGNNLYATVTTEGQTSQATPVMIAALVNPPAINTNTANLAANATTVTITGTGFDSSSNGTNNQVEFTLNASNFAGTVVSSPGNSTTSLLVSIPGGHLVSGFPLTAVVTSFGGASTSKEVAAVVPSPTINAGQQLTNVLAMPGIGATFSITGTNFATSYLNDSVTFTGAGGTMQGTVLNTSTTTQLNIQITQAPTTVGVVTAMVTANGGIVSSTVATIVPSVTTATTIVPVSGGSFVINGSGFNATFGNNTVNLNNGATATITGGSTTQLDVTYTVTGSTTVGALTASVSNNAAGGPFTSVPTVQVATLTPVLTPENVALTPSSASITIAGSFGDISGISSKSIALTDSTGTVVLATGTITSLSSSSITVTGLTGLTGGTLYAAVTLTDATNGAGTSARVQVATVTPTATVNTSNPVLATVSTITIAGSGFGTTAGNDSVTFETINGGVYAPINYSPAVTPSVASATSLTVALPSNIVAGKLFAIVTVNGQVTAQVQVATVSPVVGSIDPTANQPTFTINGSGFSTTAANDTVNLVDNGITYSNVTIVGSPTTTQIVVDNPAPFALVAGTNEMTADVSVEGFPATAFQVSLTPVVTSASATVPVTTTIYTINGFGFDPVAGASNSVTLFDNDGNSYAATVVGTPTTTSMTVSVGSISVAGDLYAIVTTLGQSSGAETEIATLAPTINAGQNPSFVSTTTTIVIAGHGFDPSGTNLVSFTSLGDPSVGGVVANSTTQLTVTLSSQPTSAGALFATVTTNGVTSASTQVATVTTVPVFQSSASQTFLEGSFSTFTVSATGSPAPTIALTGGSLPTGITYSSITDQLTGTPQPGTGGAYPLTFTATNSAGSVSQSFLLTVNEVPTFGSANNKAFTFGTAGTFGLSAATGYPTPVTFGFTGSLPSGVSLIGANDATLNVANTTAQGTYTLNLTATNSAGTGTQTFTLVINPALSLSQTPPLPGATIGAAYNQSITALNGTGSNTLVVSGVTNFTGLTISGSGTGTVSITGTPSSSGTVTFTVTATDSVGAQISSIYTITVNPAITLTPNSLPQDTSGVSYNQTITASNGTGNKNLVVSSLTNTTGLTIPVSGSNSITITGVPTAGSATFTLTATDQAGATTSTVYTITVNGVITGSALTAEGTAGTNYNHSITISGGTKAAGLYNNVSISSFSANGTGLTVGEITTNLAGMVTINGTPSGAGTASFNVNVTDAVGGTFVQNYQVVVNAALSITSSLPTGTSGGSYTATATVTGGTAPYVGGGATLINAGTTGFTSANINTSSLLSTGQVTLSGTPDNAGTTSFSFSVNVTDSAGATLTKIYSVTFNGPLGLAPASLPEGTAGTNYDQVVTVSSGTTPYTSLTVTGFSANGTGLLFNQIITNAGAGTFTIDGTPSGSGTATFTLNATDSANATISQFYTLTINPALSITSSLPQGTADSSYNQTAFVSGGTTPYTSLTVTGFSGGSTGLSSAAVTASAVAGTVSVNGTPSGAGTISFNVNVTDSAGATLTKNYSITINPAITLAPSSLTLPNGTAGAAYNETITASGGTGTVTLSVNLITDSAGLNIPGSGNGSITINGTPFQGSASFTITATDTTGASITSGVYTININPSLSFSQFSPLNPTTANFFYDQEIDVTGGTTPYTSLTISGFSSGGTGLTIGNFAINVSAGTVVLSGTPSGAGTASFNINAADSAGGTLSENFSLMVNPAITITTASLPSWTANQFYFETIGATGGTGSLTFSSTSLPSWASLDVFGDLSGTPTAGNYSIPITVTDSIGANVTETYNITINQPLQITTSTLPANWTTSTPYSQTINYTGGTAPVTFSVISGSLPSGLNLNSNVISGNPNTPQTFDFIIQASDPSGATSTMEYVGTINAPVEIINSSLLPGTVGGLYTSSVLTTGGTPSITFSQTGGTSLSTIGLSLNTSTGAITGTPTVQGNFSVTITASDSLSGFGSPTSTQSFALDIAATPMVPYETLESWTDQLPGYSQTLTVNGGSPPVSFSLAAGSGPLPNGLTLDSSGDITGQPFTGVSFPTTYDFSVIATDANGVVSAPQTFSITINPVVTMTVTTLPNWTVNQPGYFGFVPASGGTGSLQYFVTAGTLPQGLTLDQSSGEVYGTPTVAGNSDFFITAEDTTVNTEGLVPGVNAASEEFNVTIATPVTITTTSLTDWTDNNPGYNQQVIAVGGTPGGSYTWSFGTGTPPTGLNINPTTGQITGTPTAIGTFNFTVVAEDSTGATGTSGTFTVNINSPITISTLTLPNWTLNTPNYNASFGGSGGTGGLTYSFTGSIPLGLTLNTASGTLTGTPTATGTSTFTITATDTVGATASQSYTVTINPALTFNTLSLPSTTIELFYNQTLSTSGGTGSITFNLTSGLLPGSLTLTPTGNLSGVTTQSGTFNFTITATDEVGTSVAEAYSLTINPAVQVTTSTLASWTVNLSTSPSTITGQYLQTLASSGGTAPVTFALAAGSNPLPNGLSMTSAGVISGIPTAPGVYSFQVQATDSLGSQSVPVSLTITVNSPPSINTVTLPDWTQNALGYNQILSTSGGTGALTFAISAGSLPTGMVLNTTTGKISGIPTVAGPADVFITATDTLGAVSQPQEFQFTINPSITLSPSSLPNWTTGVFYNEQVVETGGTSDGLGTAQFTISSGVLPAGLFLNNSTGVISGAPSGVGTSTFTVKYIDTVGATATQTYTVTINPALNITTLSLPNWTVDQAGYLQTILSTGGTGAITFAVNPSNGLPAGLTINPTSGVISGTPTDTNGGAPYTFQIIATDSVGGTSTPQNYSILINQGITISTGSPLSSWTVNRPGYIQGISAYGGTGSLTYSNSGLPSGLIESATTGTITGTPLVSGTFTFTITVTDTTLASETQTYSLTINPALSIITNSLPSWTIGTPGYDQFILPFNGTPPVTFSVSAGSLPAGLNLNTSTGEITGTPTAVNSGSPGFTIKAIDVTGSTATMAYNLVINPALKITTTSLSPDTVNQPYTPVTIVTTGGTPLVTFAVTGGALPAGLSLNATTGTISGTPTAQGDVSITITATDAAGASYQQSFNLDINPAVVINTTSLPDWTANKSGYNQTISASPGTGNLSYTVSSGTLPNGLNLNPSTGSLTGTPTVAGTYTFTIAATDAVGSQATQSFTVNINNAIAITTSTLSPWTVNQINYNQTVATTGGTGTLTFSVSAGSLPNGLTLNSSSGAITGTPGTAGTTSFTIKVTDSVFATATQSYTVTINSPLAITTSSLASWTQGDSSYDQTVLTTGGTPTVTFSNPSGLPSGLSMSSSGVITGTPTAQGSYTFLVTATDVTGAQAQSSLTININAPLQLLTTSLNQPEWTAGKSGYSQTFSTSGGTPSIVFALASGSSSIPAGMTFNASSGTLSGTPTAGSAGTYNFTITAQDSVGAATSTPPASQTFTLTINSPISFSPTTLPVSSWTFNQSGFSQVVSASGGTGTLTYAISSGSLPAGMSMDSFGNITGTPGAIGTFNFTVKATDSIGASGTQGFTLTINKALAITTSSLPNSTVGATYSQTLNSTGGTGAVTFSILAGSLPGGLNLIGAQITGTPNSAGVFPVTIQATDSTGATAQQSYTITVNQTVQITTGSNLPDGTQGFAYNQTITASGGTLPISFSLVSGALPTGLSLNASSGVVSGVPSVSGSYSFTVQARDSVGDTGLQNFTININAPITFTTTSLPAGTVSVFYSETVAATGGTGTLTYNVTSGTIPAGMTFTNGQLSGSPTNSSTYSFTVTATDSLGATGKETFSVIINKSITITTTSLPNWTIGQPYSQTISATGGTGTLSFTVSSGTLPTGLNLVGNVISGTPSAGANTPGTSNFTITVTDSVLASTSQSYAITINPSLAITTSSLASWTVSKAGYNQTISTSGGTGNISYLISSGALPSGLTLNSSTGAITGTPTSAGTFSFNVTATDSTGEPATASLSITINPALAITTLSLPNWTLGQAYSQSIVTNGGGTLPITYAVTSGELPVGLFLDPSAGTITGTPASTNGGTAFSFTVTVTDSLGATASQKYSVLISNSIYINTSNLANWTQNLAGYSQTISATGGTGSLSFSLTSGSLPNGLNLSSGGVVTGMPTTVGTFSFTVTATDSTGASAQQTYSININPALAINTVTLENWTVNKSGYFQTVSASGGTGTVLYSVTSGALPAGLTLNAASGAITGTPSSANTYTFTITAKDTVGETASTIFTVTINPAFSITTTTLPNWTQYVSYSQTISTSGGTTTSGITYAVTSGSLPAGLFLDPNLGVISGTPISTGPSSFVITATDSVGATATKGYAITIGAAIDISTTSLAGWTLNDAGYSQQIIASGGTGALTYTVTSGTFPPGLSLSNTTGKITGTPTGTNSGNPWNFTITVSDTIGASAQASLSILINSAVTISSPPSLPNWTVGKSGYSQPIVATGGTGAITFAVSSGTLPTGLSLNSSTGLISGTPLSTNSGNPYNFTITATDSIHATSSPASYSIMINAAPTFTPTTLPGGSTAAAYVETINVVGGTAPYQSLTVVNVNGGTTGVSALNFTPNVSAGTVTVSAAPNAGTFTFQVDVTDAAGATADQNYTVNVLGLSPTALNQATAGASFSQTLSVVNGTRPLSALTISNFSAGGTGLVSGNIVPSLTAGTVVVSGKPTGAGVASFTVNITDGSGTMLSQSYSLVVNSALTVSPTSPLTEALLGSNYNNMIQFSGGTTPYASVTVTSFNGGGTGLTLANFVTDDTPDGEIFLNGTPTAGGTVTFTANITDGAGATLTQNYTLAVFGMTPSALPQGDQNAPYSQTITVTNGSRPLSSLSLNGSFQDFGTGLSASNFTINQSAGTVVINGTPSGSGFATFTLTATDNLSYSISQNYTISINPPLTFATTSPLPSGLAGNNYFQVLGLAGGTLPLKTLTVTNLTAGGTGLIAADITTNPSSGLVTVNYTPTVTGNVSFKVNATDGAGASVAQTYTFAIVPNAVSQLKVVETPVSVAAGAVLKFTVTAEDAFGNVVNDMSYQDDVTFSLGVADGNALFSTSATPNVGNAITDYTFQSSDLGTKTFYAIMTVAGPQQIIATDVTNNSVTTGSANFTVTPGAVKQLVTTITNGLDVNSNIGAGNVLTFTVSAVDAYGNVEGTGYLSGVTFTLASTDTNALFSTNANPTTANAIKSYKFVATDGGTKTFYATFGAVATGQSITVKDTTLATVTAGVTAAFNVVPGNVSKLVVTTPSTSVQAGAVVPFTISAEDKYGNILTAGYADNVSFSLATTDLNSVFATDPGFVNIVTAYQFGPSDNGVVTIYGMFGKVGAQSFIATDTSLPTVTGSAAFTVKPGAADQIAFVSAPPASVQNGASMPISVLVEDEYGNAVTAPATTVTLSFSGGLFSNLTSMLTSTTNSTGVASFTVANWNASSLDTTCSFTATDGAAVSPTANFFVTGKAQNLQYANGAPYTTTAGTSFNVQVQAYDTNGFAVSTNSTPIAVTLTLTGAKFSTGSSLVSASTNSSGLANFNVTINTATNSTFNLTASTSTAGVISTVTTVAVSPANPAKMVFTTQPSATIAAGNTFNPITVTLTDAYGNAEANMPVDIGLNTGSLTAGTTPIVTNSLGQAIFSDLVEDTSGVYSLTANAIGVNQVNSNQFTVKAGTAESIAFYPGDSFASNPTYAAATGNLNNQVSVQVEDQFGNPVTSTLVTLSLSGGVFSTNSAIVTASTNSSGIAAFSSLAVTTAGTYSVTANVGGLDTSPSGTFYIVAGNPAKVKFTAEPVSTMAGNVLNNVSVFVTDAFNNIEVGVPVNIALNKNSLAAGTTPQYTDGTGTATFDDLQIDTAATSYVLTASVTGVATVNSTSFSITAGTAQNVVFLTQPTNTIVNKVFSTPIEVEVTDQYNNPVSGAAISITLNSGNFSAGTTSGITASNGIFTFSGLEVATEGSYSVTVGGTFGSNTSNSFIITGLPAELQFTTEPDATVPVNSPMNTDVGGVVVQLYDSDGNAVSEAGITVTMAASGKMTGTLKAVTNSLGQAIFTNLNMTVAGTFSLTATSTGLASVVSSSFTATTNPSRFG